MQTLHVIISFKYEDKYIKTTWRNSAHIVQKWPSIYAAEIVSLNIKTTGSST
jgi:hypothetical protein